MFRNQFLVPASSIFVPVSAFLSAFFSAPAGFFFPNSNALVKIVHMKTGLECGGTRWTIPLFELATTIAMVAVKMTAVNICKERVWSVCGVGVTSYVRCTN